ncbi:ABC transporter ATP-binding protein [Chelatococcus reniformis]|uniref:ABC transporter ATP-binding protein n=1 Tax=Chelatococcus reniformis TaxID=1494448 RepID=A0A916UUM1_9HYPH|nr:ABC transporter ATP-binding protein [Chelatococcus reniformis]GGC89297.1 ABC transporter ATP-binding protein [Chelatococcus reniformis]
MNVLDAADLTVRYGGSVALRDATLAVGAGRLVAVAGANGAGKSTLVNACAGWSRGHASIAGDVRLDGRSVARLAAYRRARLGIQCVPEGKNVFGELTVEENFALVPAVPREAGRHVFSREDVLGLFPRLHERRTHKGSALSGGERQMLAIGRALLAGPRILLLDEPSVGLAPRLIFDVLTVVRRLVDDGLAVLLVEQNVSAALDVADELYLIERGRIVGHGDAAAMRQDERIAQAYLGGLAEVEP